MIKDVQRIYNQMSDTLSKQIFMDRLNYSITQDFGYIETMVNHTLRRSAKWLTFYRLLKEKAKHAPMYIFGAGIWANILYQETKEMIPWKAAIDSYPVGKKVGQLPVIAADQLSDMKQQDIIIVISSYKNGQEMAAQIQRAGIPEYRIMDAGKLIYELTEGAIYFDLGQLYPQFSYEAFVDAGCYDGLTAKGFFEWCEKEGYVYCFEPDRKNVETIQRNLFDCTDQYELAEKALWSETKRLCIDARGDYASSVREPDGADTGQITEAVALDDYLAGRQVTFLKMDVEGAEEEVLKGARNTIMQQHPRLAVSVYHKLSDIQTLPELILSYYPGYRLYLRHYSFSDYDTVLYALPLEETGRIHLTNSSVGALREVQASFAGEAECL